MGKCEREVLKILEGDCNTPVGVFSKIEGDEDTIMGLPIKKIKEYINSL